MMKLNSLTAMGFVLAATNTTHALEKSDQSYVAIAPRTARYFCAKASGEAYRGKGKGTSGRALFASPPMHAAAPVLSLRPPPSFSNAAASATGVTTQPSEKEPFASGGVHRSQRRTAR